MPVVHISGGLRVTGVYADGSKEEGNGIVCPKHTKQYRKYKSRQPAFEASFNCPYCLRAKPHPDHEFVVQRVYDGVAYPCEVLDLDADLVVFTGSEQDCYRWLQWDDMV